MIDVKDFARWTLLLAGVAIGLVAVNLQASIVDAPQTEYRTWIADMKASERGPFKRIRWFCRDGSVLPPRSSGCEGRGGGFQHGEWSLEAQRLRNEGFRIANILAGMDAEKFVDSEGFFDQYAQLLIERFLIRTDNGWILRRALFYRGAIQEEDERESARNLLLELAGRDDWIGFRFPALRAGVGLLPHGTDSATIQQIRQESAALSNRDDGFLPLRAKIHGAPGAEDAESVRRYARNLEPGLRAPYITLADHIDAVYRAAPMHEELRATAERFAETPWLRARLQAAAAMLRLAGTSANIFETTAEILAELRESLPRIPLASQRLEAIELSIRLENENYRAAASLLVQRTGMSRYRQARLLASAGRAAYGTGVINRRLLTEMLKSLETLNTASTGLSHYRSVLTYLGYAPGWGTQALRMHFFESMQKLAQIEPLAMLFIQDQLRASPLLFYSKLLDGLTRDANRLAGVSHRLFESDVGVGLTALNPGLARGVLHAEPDLSRPAGLHADGIYVLPETISDLPPVAGILTAGEGNPLSHVQLLARNLGIPNVAVSADRVRELSTRDGETVVMAVSRLGRVEISPMSGRWQDLFRSGSSDPGVEIDPDLNKLDLSVSGFIPLDKLRVDDSGRTVGPKAAKLGELRGHYPGMVSRGLALPFGLFRKVALDRPRPGHEDTVWEWMVARYGALAALPEGSEARNRETDAFRLELYNTIVNTPLDTSFRESLKAALESTFGEPVPGLFVRSDTNIEDLAGFTGAGLNLTLPNVVEFEQLLEAIPRVWASPFTRRAFAWRQDFMARPEHVYTSILLLETVAVEKSGVLVTQDIDSGDTATISVAVNEGMGGAVDGQASESLRISTETGKVQVLATATAPWRRVTDHAGGLQRLPASGAMEVLTPGEIEVLIDFTRNLPATFPPITDDRGNIASADVEFGFLNGQLILFQLRPFLDSHRAAGIEYLQEMDSRLEDVHGITVDLRRAP